MLPEPEVIDCPPVEKCERGGTVHIKGTYKRKQLVDIQVILKVTEERVSVGYCEKCGKRHEGTYGWALTLRSFFFDADKRKKELMDKGEYFSDQEIKDYFTKFLEILDMGDAEYQQAIEGKQRIVRYNEEKYLLKRPREYVSEHLNRHE